MLRKRSYGSSCTWWAISTSPTTPTLLSSVGTWRSVHPIDGSLLSVTVDGTTENVHFFTDHVAGAIPNPRDLPFSEQSLDLIRQLGRTIGGRCKVRERSSDLSSLLLRWAEASYEKKKEIDAVLQNRSDDRLSPEQLERIQSILLDQVAVLQPLHA